MHYNQLKQINPVPSVLWHGIFAAGHVEANRRLYNHEFVFWRKGEGRMIIEGQVFKCSPGNMIIIPPDVVHCTIADTEIERWCLHFDWEPGNEVPYLPYEYSDSLSSFVSSKCNFTPEWVPYQLPLIRTAPDYEMLSKLVRKLFSCNDKSLEDGMRQKGIFLQILSLCFTESSSKKSYMPPLLLKAKEYIDINFRNPDLNVSKVAVKNSVTSNHICRLFQKELGISPLEYINSLRLKHACELLVNSFIERCSGSFRDRLQRSKLFLTLIQKEKRSLSVKLYRLKLSLE